MARHKPKKKRSKKSVAASPGQPQTGREAIARPPQEPAATPDAPISRKRQVLLLVAWLIPLAAVFFLYWSLKMYGVGASAGDEHIYLYQSQLIAQGVAPYSGFAMAHPPLQMIFTGALFKLFGYHLTLGRLLPMLWCFFGGIGLAVLVRRELGIIASVAATGLYLLAYEPLRASSHYTGVNMTVALLIFAVLAYRTGRIRLTAVIAVAAVFTRLYAAPGVLVLTAFALVVDRRQGLRLIAWGAGLGIAALVSVGLWAGFGDMFHNMLLYHTQKTPMSPEKLAKMHDGVLFHNAVEAAIFVIAQAAVVQAVWGAYMRQGKAPGPGGLARIRAAFVSSGTGLPILCSAIAVVVLLVLNSMDRVWMYYFIPSFPFAAVASGWLISRWLRALWRLIVHRGRLRRAGLSVPAVLGGVLLFVLLTASYLYAPRLEARLDYYKAAMERDPNARSYTYDWRPGRLPDFVDRAVKAAFWQEKRTMGEPYNRFTFLLWHENRVLDIVDGVVATILANTREDDEIFGDSGTVPLFALLSGRRIAANEVDTNIQRYLSGNADPKALVKKLTAAGTELIILRSRFGVGGVREIQALVKEKYAEIRKLRTTDGRLYTVYRRR